MEKETTAVQYLLTALGLDNATDTEETQAAFVHRVLTMGDEDWANLVGICQTALMNESIQTAKVYAEGAGWAWAHPVDKDCNDSSATLF